MTPDTRRSSRATRSGARAGRRRLRGAAQGRDRAAVHRRVRRREGRRHVPLRRLRRRAVQLGHEVRLRHRLAELHRPDGRRRRRAARTDASHGMVAHRGHCARAAAATSGTSSTTARDAAASATASTPARWTSSPGGRVAPADPDRSRWHRSTPRSWQAEIELDEGRDPAAVGAAATVELCGSWDHEGACRWPSQQRDRQLAHAGARSNRSSSAVHEQRTAGTALA